MELGPLLVLVVLVVLVVVELLLVHVGAGGGRAGAWCSFWCKSNSLLQVTDVRINQKQGREGQVTRGGKAPAFVSQTNHPQIHA